METIGSRISAILTEKKITQNELAKKINVSPSLISKVRSGDCEISDRTISDICRVCGVSEAWLRYGEGDQFVERSANEELTKLLADVMTESDDSFRKRVLTAMLSLPPEWWDTLNEELKKRFG